MTFKGFQNSQSQCAIYTGARKASFCPRSWRVLAGAEREVWRIGGANSKRGAYLKLGANSSIYGMYNFLINTIKIIRDGPHPFTPFRGLIQKVMTHPLSVSPSPHPHFPYFLTTPSRSALSSVTHDSERLSLFTFKY